MSTNSETKITDKQRKLLKHMLGAEDHYLKREWGFRNRYESTPGNNDHKNLLAMKQSGLVHGDQFGWFWATRKGALEIGFKAYQLKKAKL